jgi:hypothetical protein
MFQGSGDVQSGTGDSTDLEHLSQSVKQLDIKGNKPEAFL